MPMAKLKLTMEAIACTKVQTHIQTGNVVFKSRVKTENTLKKKLVDAIEKEFKFRPKLMLLSEEQLRAAISKNPFQSATSEARSLHFFFLDAKPNRETLAAAKKLTTKSERCELIDCVFYLHTPDGFGKSKLASSAERKLAVAATARNFSTVEELASMVNP